MSEYYLGIDVHKSDSTVVVQDAEGQIVDEQVTATDALDDIAAEYADNQAAIEASGSYFAVYDTLDEYLDVTLVNPLKADWLAGRGQKSDTVDAKQLARFLRLDELPESYVPPKEIRRYRALARGRKKLVEKRTACKNEVHAILDQNQVSYDGVLWSDDGREYLEEVSLPEPADILLDQWLEAIDTFTTMITRLQRTIERVARDIEEVRLLETIPGIAAYSGVMIYSEIGEIDRFDRAAELVSYAGLDPVVRESGETRREGSISKEGNGYLRWILVQAANTAVNTVKDPYLRDFYTRLRQSRGKPHQVAIVATARKLLVSIFHMLSKEEQYDPPEVTTH